MHCRWLWASIIWPRFVQFPVTLNNFEGHSPVAGLFECTSTNIYATFHTISTDTTRRSFPRRQLSFLSRLLLYLTVSCVWTVGFRPRAHYAQLVKLDEVHVKFIWSVAYCRIAYNRNKRLVCVRLSVHMSIPSIMLRVTHMGQHRYAASVRFGFIVRGLIYLSSATVADNE